MAGTGAAGSRDRPASGQVSLKGVALLLGASYLWLAVTSRCLPAPPLRWSWRCNTMRGRDGHGPVAWSAVTRFMIVESVSSPCSMGANVHGDFTLR